MSIVLFQFSHVTRHFTRHCSVHKKISWFLLFLVFTVVSFRLPSVSLAEEMNLLNNPSFEEVDEKGLPIGWSMNKRTYSIVGDQARTGKKCLKYINTDPDHYDFCSQRLHFTPGDIYLFSCWIKTENIVGKDTGATICIQWADQEGKYISGSFPTGIVGTRNEWTLIQGRTAPIPEKANAVTLSLYVRREMTGIAWFDDIKVEKYHPPYLNVMTTDRYRQITDGGPVVVSVGINPLIKTKTSSSDTPKLSISSKMLQKPILVAPKERKPDEVIFEFDSTPLLPGEYKIECAAIQPDSGQKEVVQLTMNRVEKYPVRKAYIDSYRRLIVDGKPFFPLGMYFGGVSDDHLEIYAKSAFNCIMPYARIDRKTLDKIDAKGVKVVYSVKDLYKGVQGLETEEKADEKVREVVEKIKDHPAIIAWYINDEYPLSRLAELIARRDMMERLDPGRPTWAVLYQIDEIREYLPTFDVAGTDPYPIATKPAAVAYNWSVRTNQGMFSKKAVWQVPQIFDWSLHKKHEARLGERAPTGQEMRAMYWMGIAGGANGLIAYCWHDLHFMDIGPSDKPRTPLIRKPFEQSWTELTHIAQEIAESFDILLSIDEPLKIQLDEYDSLSPKVGARFYGLGDTTWILLVNLTEKPLTTTLNADTFIRMTGTRLGSSDKVAVDGKKITVHLDALEPLFIGVKKDNNR